MTRILKPLLRIAQVIFLLSLVYFAIRLALYHYHLVIFPYANTLREGAMMTSTDALVKGLNPYAFALQPRSMNQYGILYPLFVWPWAKLFGTTILVHRMATAFFILASCLLIYFVLKRMAVPLLLNVWAVLMLYASLMYPGTSTPTIDPGAMGMFLFLLTVFIPWFCKYTYKSLVISVICGILAFYTKAYVFLGVFIMVSYLFLFVSKQKGLFYGFLLLVLSVASIMFVSHILPAYFDNCFFAAVNMGPAWSSMERLHEQIILYWDIHQWTFILIAAIFLYHIYIAIRHHFADTIKRNITAVFLSFNLTKIREPLVKLDLPLVLYAGLCSTFVLYMSLGRHSGAMLWYFFQLLSPFFLIGAAWLFSRITYWPIFCVPFLIVNLYTITADQNSDSFKKNLANWPELTLLLSQHQHILNSPLIAPLLIQQNKEIIDDGQAEYFLPGGERNYWMKGWLKEDYRIYIQQILFFQNIRNMVESKGFDLIVLQPSLMPMGVAEDIKKYYKCEGQVLLYVPQDRRSYAVTVWLPL